MAKRTTHHNKSGTKLYAQRGKSGKFEDIQTFERAQERDVKRKSKAEGAKKVKPKAKTAGKKQGAVKKK